MPKISVILPYRNAEKTLEAAVNSILCQSFDDFELLLTDNASDDDGGKIGADFALRDKRIRLLYEDRQGVVFASQKAFDYSRASVLARADADDVWHPRKLELQFNFLDKHPDIDVVSCCVNYIGDSKNEGMRIYVEETNKCLNDEDISLNRFIELQVINPTIMFRKETALKHGFYREGMFPEDYEMFLRWSENGVKYHKLEQRLLDWYDHDERLTRTDPRYSFDAFYEIKAAYLNRMLKRTNPFYPDIVLWGAGQLSRKRFSYLDKQGVNALYMIDVDAAKINDRTIISHFDIPDPGKIFIVSYVNNRGARQEIREFLHGRGYAEGKDFIMA
jgi:glycosyltransferase involved in cell wall biosynthesis